MNGAEKVAQHTLQLQNRELLHLCGVQEVVSFDENSVILKTSMGALSVDGRELTVKKLDTDRGEVCVQGRICGVNYLDDGAVGTPKSAKRAGRLFR